MKKLVKKDSHPLVVEKDRNFSEAQQNTCVSHVTTNPRYFSNESYEIAKIIVDQNFKVIEADKNYRRLYKVDDGFEPQTLQDIVEDRLKRGWFSLAELISNERNSSLRLREIRSTPVGATIQFSPKGEILIASHLTPSHLTPTELSYARTGLKLNQEVGTRDAGSTLLLLSKLLSKSSENSAQSRFLFCEIDDPTLNCARNLRFIADISGRVLFLNEPHEFHTKLKNLENIQELNIPLAQMMVQLGKQEKYSTVVENSIFSKSLVVSKFVHVFKDGPGFIVGSIIPFDELFSPQSVKVLFPKFTLQEANAIACIVQGRTIKEAAGYLEKSHVTVALQARSAINKSQCNSIEELMSHIIVLVVSRL